MYAISDDDEWEAFMQSEEFLYYESLTQAEQEAAEEAEKNPPAEEESTNLDEEPAEPAEPKEEETPGETDPTPEEPSEEKPKEETAPESKPGEYGSSCGADADCGDALLCGSVYFDRIQAQKVCVNADDCYTRIKYTD